MSVEATAEIQRRFLGHIDNIRSESVALRDSFEALWLRTNQPANLQYALNEYDWLRQSWDNAAARVMAGRFAYDPVLPEQWIYHPDILTNPEGVQNVFFRKTIDVAAPLQRAHLQLYGDSHVVLFVNGRELGEQVARRNSTAPVNSHLVQVYDIGPYLRQGKNVIAVEAHKYDPRSYGEFTGIGQVRGAGMHVYGEILDDRAHLLRIVADATWKVSDTGLDRWSTSAYNDSGWLPAMRAPDSRYFVTIPDFTRNFPGINHRR